MCRLRFLIPPYFFLLLPFLLFASCSGQKESGQEDQEELSSGESMTGDEEAGKESENEETEAADGVPGSLENSPDCTDPRQAQLEENAPYCGDSKGLCPGGLPRRLFYRDHDRDHHGDPEFVREFCAPPPPFVADSTDCDDHNREVHPNRRDCAAIWRRDFSGNWHLDPVADNLDNNCNGEIDEETECGHRFLEDPAPPPPSPGGPPPGPLSPS